MINYVVAFVLAAIIYLIAVGYLKNFCPVNKFLKLVIYICISLVSLAIVNYIHPTKAGEEGMVSSLMHTVSNTEDTVDSDWETAQQKANSLVNGEGSQVGQQMSDNHDDNYHTEAQVNQRTDEQSQDILIGRNGKVLN